MSSTQALSFLLFDLGMRRVRVHTNQGFPFSPVPKTRQLPIPEKWGLFAFKETMKKALSEIRDTEAKREHGDISSLKESIAELGLINPLTVNESGALLAGRRRFQAVSELGWQEVEVTVLPVNGDRLRAFRVAIDENLKRKNLTDPEVAIAIKEYDGLKRRLEGEAKAGRPEIGHTVTNNAGWSLQKTADDLAISKPAVVKAIKIATAIEEYPDLAKEHSGQQILSEYKRKHVGEIPIPQGQYRTIVIDPPWPVEKILRNERPNQYDFGYATMSIEDIKAFPLGKIAFEDGTHVYLWTTQKFLPTAFDIFRAWGVNYECLLTWVKNVGFTPFSWMYSTEHCLFGRIGNLPLLRLGRRLDIHAKVREHSRKPQEFYDLVREVSPEPRMDIFSREKHNGFEQYGNEKDAF